LKPFIAINDVLDRFHLNRPLLSLTVSPLKWFCVSSEISIMTQVCGQSSSVSHRADGGRNPERIAVGSNGIRRPPLTGREISRRCCGSASMLRGSNKILMRFDCAPRLCHRFFASKFDMRTRPVVFETAQKTKLVFCDCNEIFGEFTLFRCRRYRITGIGFVGICFTVAGKTWRRSVYLFIL
jgi:hypothetical protein